MAKSEDKKKAEDTAMTKGLPIGLAVGLSIGVALGVGTDNLALGVGVGLSMGIALSFAFGQAMIDDEKKKSENAGDDAPDQE